MTMQATSPRRVVVRVGSPTFRFPMSATMNTSHWNRSGWAWTKASRVELVSSIPSTMSLTWHGGDPSKTFRVPAWITNPLLSSEIPRPYNRPSSLRVGVHGSDDQPCSGGAGWTS